MNASHVSRVVGGLAATLLLAGGALLPAEEPVRSPSKKTLAPESPTSKPAQLGQPLSSPAGPAAAPAKADNKTDPAIYTKLLYYVGPAPGYRVPPKSDSLDGILAGYSMEYSKQIKDLKVLETKFSGENGAALKAEAVKNGVGFILEVYVYNLRETKDKIEWRADHRMLMFRSGKWETVFQGPVQHEGTSAFTLNDSVRLMVPRLRVECSPALLYKNFLTKMVKVKRVTAVKTQGPQAAPHWHITLKATNNLPYPFSKATVTFTKRPMTIVPLSEGAFSGINYADEESCRVDPATTFEPGQEREFTVEMSDEHYRSYGNAPLSMSYERIGRPSEKPVSITPWGGR